MNYIIIVPHHMLCFGERVLVVWSPRTIEIEIYGVAMYVSGISVYYVCTRIQLLRAVQNKCNIVWVLNVIKTCPFSIDYCGLFHFTDYNTQREQVPVPSTDASHQVYLFAILRFRSQTVTIHSLLPCLAPFCNYLHFCIRLHSPRT